MTATLPLILLGAMFFRGVNLPGFQQGLALLFVPEVDGFSIEIHQRNGIYMNLAFDICLALSFEIIFVLQ